jgi:hypothetical protein
VFDSVGVEPLSAARLKKGIVKMQWNFDELLRELLLG